jgi:hypothetical protein
LATDQISRERRQALVRAVCPTVFDRNVLSFDKTGFAEPPSKRGEDAREGLWRAAVEEAYYRCRRLLRVCSNRSRDRRPAKKRDELASPHSITFTSRTTKADG